MPAGDIEVIRIGNRWFVRTQGDHRELGVYRLKTTAVTVGRAFARHYRVELIVKRRDGRIGRRDSHGNDPRNIPG